MNPLRCLIRGALMAAGIAAAAPSLAYDASGDGKVTLIEVTYMPGSIQFQLNTAIGSCRPGQWIFWHPRGETQTAKDQNAQAVLSTLMTAKTASQSVRVYLTSAGCSAEFLYLI